MKVGKNILEAMRASQTREKRFILLCVLIGILAGALAVAFRLAIEFVFAFSWRVGGSLGEDNRFWLMPLLPALGGIVAGLCVSSFAKSASGSGIPQTKAAYYNDFGIFRWRDVFYRFFLGAIFCGSGNSAGREGPTVHLCSAAASALAQNFGFAKSRVRDAVPAGMGAGIAASFNAPLSAISFVYEELLGGFGNSKKNGGLIVSVVIAAVVARLMLGENPVLPIGIAEFHTGWWMLVALPIALFSGIAGNIFLQTLLRLRSWAREKSRLPIWLLAMLGGLIVGCMGMFAYWQTGYNSVFSVGYSILLPAFGSEVCFKAMLMIFVFKFFATIVNYAMGGSGGLFSPTLVIGGMLGGACGAAAVFIFDLDSSVIGASVLLGMGACFASIIRCPITSILMIFELTLNYSLILPLLAANLISYVIAKKLHPVGLYDSLLLQDGISLRKMTSAKNSRDWQNIPTSAIMTFNPECINAHLRPRDALKEIDLRKLRFRAYPLVNSVGDFCGCVSVDELKSEVDSEKSCAQIGQCNGSMRVLFADDSLAEAANYFITTDRYEAVVVDRLRPHLPLGILTLHDIARYNGGL